jgi:hypothetical protein
MMGRTIELGTELQDDERQQKGRKLATIPDCARMKSPKTDVNTTREYDTSRDIVTMVRTTME